MNEIRYGRRWASWQWVTGIWLTAVVYIFLAGWLGLRLLAGFMGWGGGVTEQIQHAAPSLSTLFVRWDSGYYSAIAEHGYSASGAERAFFPLYPLLVRWLSRVNGLSIWWNGLILSVTAFGAASAIFYAWVRCDHSRTVALLATALLCFSPVSFYLVAFYAEPLFLAVGLFGLYCARRGWFLASGIGIALASATRPTAFLLGVAYVIEILLQRPLSARAWVMAIAGALLAPLGALAYFNWV